MPDRYALYQLCAQSPERDAKVIAAIHADQAGATRGKAPRTAGLILGEDFCADAALALAWCRLNTSNRAVAVDHDASVLARAKHHPRLQRVHSDVMHASLRADLIAVLNFSICELHARRSLVAYLSHARERLAHSNRGGGAGTFLCDIYAGPDAGTLGTQWQTFETPDGTRVRYAWEQRVYDPLTARVVNAMHFEVRPARVGTKRPATKQPATKPPAKRAAATLRLHDAFVYHWRLWSVPELRDAMIEAGFARTLVYPRTIGAIDHRGGIHVRPIESPDELDDSHNVFVVARTR